MSKVILTDRAIVEIGRLLGEDFNRLGDSRADTGNAEGLYLEAFMDLTGSDNMDGAMEFYIAEEEKVLDFFRGTKSMAQERNKS